MSNEEAMKQATEIVLAVVTKITLESKVTIVALAARLIKQSS